MNFFGKYDNIYEDVILLNNRDIYILEVFVFEEEIS